MFRVSRVEGRREIAERTDRKKWFNYREKERKKQRRGQNEANRGKAKEWKQTKSKIPEAQNPYTQKPKNRLDPFNSLNPKKKLIPYFLNCIYPKTPQAYSPKP